MCGRHFSQFAEQKGAQLVSVGGALASHSINLRDSGAWQQVLSSVSPDYVLHMAGTTKGDLTEIREVNVGIATALLSACATSASDLKSILLIGSGAEYGPPEDLPLTESSLCKPGAPYGISKLEQTDLGLKAAHNGLPVTILRPFNILGPGISPRLFLGAMLKQIGDIESGKQSKRLEVGNLDSQRDFIDVRDFCEVVWCLLHEPKAVGEVFNLCSGVPIIMSDLLNTLLELKGLDDVVIEQRKSEPNPHDIPVHFGSNEKLYEYTGFKPNWNYRDSLEHIIEAASFGS